METEKILCGKVILYRTTCDRCGESNLSGNKNFECDCGNSYQNKQYSKTRVLSGSKRRRPSREKVKELIQAQDNKCFYCGNEFGKYYVHNSKFGTLKYHADHITPFSMLNSNPDDNWALACSICNLHKHSKVFDNIETCRKYLLYTLEKKISTKVLVFLND